MKHLLLICAYAGLACSGVALAQTSAAIQKPTSLYLPLPGDAGGRWLLLDAKHKPLREADIVQLGDFRRHNGNLLPASAQNTKKLWGFLNAAGKWAIQPQYQDAEDFSAAGFARFQQAGKWGFLGSDLKTHIPAQYEEVEDFSNGMAAFRKGKLWGFLDTTGAVRIPAKYDRVWPFSKNGLARILHKDKNIGFIDRAGELAIAADYDYALEFGNENITAASIIKNKDHVAGLIDNQGKWILKPQYQHIGYFNSEQLAAFKDKDDKVGFINTRGQVVIAAQKNLSEYMGAQRVRLGSGSDYTFLNAQGKPAIQESVDWVDHFYNDGLPIAARKLGAWGLLTVQGKWLPVGDGREPMLDSDDEVSTADSDTELSTWLHANRAIEWRDAQANIVYRLEPFVLPNSKKTAIRLMHGDNTVWQSGAFGEPLALRPYFERDIEDVLTTPLTETTALARKLLVAVPRKFVLPRPVFDKTDSSPYKFDKNDVLEEDILNGAIHILSRDYVSEESWGKYHFLMDQRTSVFIQLKVKLCERLTAEFGAPLTHKSETVPPAVRASKTLCAWKSKDRWLFVNAAMDTGDGEFENVVSLVVLTPESSKPAAPIRK
jgi:hypothetical protein